MNERLIQWKSLELKLAGSELEPIVQKQLSRPGSKVSDVELALERGELRITGKAKTFMTIPFEITVREIEAEGQKIVVLIDSISAAGLPVPKLLSSMFDRSAAGGAVVVDGNGPTVTVFLDRFLPEFIDVELDEILIVEDGLLIRTGSGGADLPKGA